MARKGGIYKKVCGELLKILKLHPEFSLGRFIKEENVTLEDGKGFYANLKLYREKLELDNHIMCDDKETQKIMDEGLRIQSIIAKERLYGKD